MADEQQPAAQDQVSNSQEPVQQPSVTPQESSVTQPTATVPQPFGAAAGSTTTPPAPLSQNSRPKRAKWVLPAVIAGAVLLLGGGGAYGYFGVYMQTPENLWKQALKNTGNGFKNYVEKPAEKSKTTKIDGSFKLTEPTAADGTISGISDDKNATLTASLGVSGVRATLDLKATTPEGASNPDVYIKAGGLKSLSALTGGDETEFGSIISEVDEQWFFVDHTLLDQATKELTAATEEEKLPSNEQIIKELEETSKKMATVLNERLFTTDEAKASIVVKEALEKEDFKGRKSQHYKVQVKKDQFKELLKELRSTVKGTETEKLFLDGYNQGAGTDEAPTFDELLKELDTVNFDNAVADVWVDTSLKYVRNVRISGNENGMNTAIDFMLDFKGGNELPLSITLNSKNKTGEGSASLGMLLNQKSSAVTFTAGIDLALDGQKVRLDATLKSEPTTETVKVEKPEGARNIMELLGGLSDELSGIQSQFGGLGGGFEDISGSTLDCVSQLDAFANSGGTSSIDDACLQNDDTEI